MRRSARGLVAAALLGPLAVGVTACRDDPEPPPPPCGLALEGCGSGTHCDRIAIPPRCVCNEQLSGTGCTSCALGYERRSGSCVPESVDCQDDPCGTRGECVSSSAGDECRCDEEYVGNWCGACADGFQDHDNDGVCRPSCGVAPLACTGRSACSDATGVARCACPNGYIGERCDECDSGYRPVPGALQCVPTCASPDVSCAEHGACREGPEGAECVCQPGWAGDACDDCDSGYGLTDAGDCVAPIPAEAVALTVMELGGTQWLAALSRPAWQLHPVAPLGQAVDAVAWDADAAVLYGLSQGALVGIDPSTGAVEQLISANPPLGSTLSHDPSRGVLYAATASELFQIDVGGAGVSSVAARGAVAIEYDAAADRLLMLEATPGGSSLQQLEWDPETGALTEGGLVGAPEAPGSAALTVDPGSGLAYLLGSAPEDATDALARYCREAARVLTVPAEHSTPTGEFGDAVAPGESRTLTDDGTDPPLLMYGSEGDLTEAAATLLVASQHPDAIVCVVTEEQPLEVVVQAGTRLGLLIVASIADTVAVRVEDGFEAAATFLHIATEDPSSVAAADGTYRTYNAGEWAALGLSQFSIPDSLRTLPTLGPLDWPSGAAAALPIDAEGATVVAALTPYSGGP